MRRILILALVLGGAATAVLVSVIFWPALEVSLISRVLLIDAIIVACGGALIVVLGRTVREKWVHWTPWVVCGALVGAAAMGSVAVGVWLLVAASLIAASGAIGGLGGGRGLLARLTVASVAVPLNIAFLADVPLHDVWVVRLRGGGSGRDIRDVQKLFFGGGMGQQTPIVIGLAGLRGLLGFAFRWDAGMEGDPASSYMHRLTDADRERSFVEPDHDRGAFFRRIYIFEHEALLEIINRTVHAFFAMGMAPADDGYTLYWAIYVKRVNWFTPYYMTLVDPFRRLFVYPVWMRRLEHGWALHWQTLTEDGKPARVEGIGQLDKR
jgi:hypothetical protein